MQRAPSRRIERFLPNTSEKAGNTKAGSTKRSFVLRGERGFLAPLSATRGGKAGERERKSGIPLFRFLASAREKRDSAFRFLAPAPAFLVRERESGKAKKRAKGSQPERDRKRSGRKSLKDLKDERAEERAKHEAFPSPLSKTRLSPLQVARGFLFSNENLFHQRVPRAPARKPPLFPSPTPQPGSEKAAGALCWRGGKYHASIHSCVRSPRSSGRSLLVAQLHALISFQRWRLLKNMFHFRGIRITESPPENDCAAWIRGTRVGVSRSALEKLFGFGKPAWIRGMRVRVRVSPLAKE